MTAEEFADILDRNLDIIMLEAAAQTEGTPAERLWLDGSRAGIEGAIEQMRAISWRGDLASSTAVPPSETGPADDATRTTGHETGHAAHGSNAATTQATTHYAPRTSDAWTKARRSPAGAAVPPSTPSAGTSDTTTMIGRPTAGPSACRATWRRADGRKRTHTSSSKPSVDPRGSGSPESPGSGLPHFPGEDKRMRTCEIEGCPRKHVAKGMCGTHYNQANYTSEQRHKKQLRPCAACGRLVEKAKSGTRRTVCSYRCRYILQFGKEPLPQPTRALVGPIPRATLPTTTVIPSTLPVLVGVWCRNCGSGFVDWNSGRSHRVRFFCSPRCKRRWKRRSKRSNRFWVSDRKRHAIYDRDCWICQICLTGIDSDALPGSDWGPCLDHIIPRSRGGTDDEDNLRLAHGWCNAIRGADLLPDEFFRSHDGARDPGECTSAAP